MSEANNSTNGIYDYAVVGSGLTGLTAALALAEIARSQGKRLVHVAPRNEGQDGRTTALLMPSIRMLENMNVWDDVADESAELQTMRLVDGSKRLLRAPLTDFRSSELNIDAFGYNIPNAKLGVALEAKLTGHESVDRLEGMVAHADCGADGVTLTLDSGAVVHAQTVAAADGRNSPLREAAGIGVREWSYPQTAIVMNFQHSLPHNGVSTEFHTETGPFTQVPLPPLPETRHRSSLVWVVRPEQVDEILAMETNAMALMVEEKMQSMLGRITIENQPQTFPLKGMVAKRFMVNNVALLGEAAHVFPPIGAQGFNLGLRDVEAFADAVSKGSSVEMRYNANRLGDVVTRTGAVDLLNRSLLIDFLPVQAARAIGLAAVGQLGWLRRQLMQRGLGAKVA
ncbi:UbiH/UbiF family hydroxylase [Pseudahrensia aquimaris]|uniref:UbiH/UbiF family hydroxylase n=1 Tax=Pseudahrensia aquimaris TaxID=744461 RepID=A0ABW3FIN1_9HYPH